MTLLEGILLWSSIFILVISFLGHLAGVIFKKERPVYLSYISTLVGFVFLSGAVLTRWISTGHMPVMGTYENSLFGAWFVMLAFLFTLRYFPKGRILSLVVMPATVLILGNGIMAKAEMAPLEPPYQSTWLYVHVFFAWFAFGSYLMATAVSIIYLSKSSKANSNKGTGAVTLTPALTRLDEICLKFIMFGFITDAVMIGAGAIWAHGLWGRYWGWDPIETWSLITWLTYGINLHLRLTLGWKGKKASWLALFSFLGIIIAFFGVGFVGDVHTQIMKP